MTEATVSAGYTRALLDFAISKGAGERKLLMRAGIAAEALGDQDNRLPYACYVALMRAAKEETGDPALALEFGAASDIRAFSVVGLISHAAANMMEALMQLNRYGRLVVDVEGVADGARFELTTVNGQRWMEDRRANPNDFPEMTESTWSRFIVATRRDFPQHTYALEAHVTHAAPAYRARYEELWQVPVTFSGHWNAIRSDLAWERVEIQPENRYVFGVLTERGDALLQEMEASRTVRGRVEALIMPILHTGEVSVETIAGKLGTSRQTLYRNLKDEGVTFEQVLDALRHRMALDYIASRKVSVNETAYLVGFSDPASFSRAFKRWTGKSPRDWRNGSATGAP
ncbi:AraC family transcriptional regulator [Terricaulis sp.]|uniref:AraC family transcriptional regulator n=1 Tax=Terricaulis sp. TaxID=2768686 RepID=UPI002AC6907F|nr:AraC family transcriptional regulator ligand-binding domain-containing protein [Terricaulis sp.]MDZ4692898.1 AraC family transcriptional regulator ligand-binding domain-containing protein [Terricaulis sp.]